MTTQGLQLINDYGVVSIGTGTCGMGYAGKQTVTFANQSSAVVASATVTGSSPVIAWASADPICCLGASQSGGQSGGTWTFLLASAGAAGGTATVYAFDRMSAITPPAGGGLECFDASGARTYHSAIRPLSVLGVYTNYPGPPGSTPPVTSTALASGTYALMQSGLGTRHAITSEPGSDLMSLTTLCASVAPGAGATALQYGQIITYQDTLLSYSGPTYVETVTATYLLIDATGLA